MSSSRERAALSFRRLRGDRTQPASVFELARAYSKRMHATHDFGHATAALIHGMWLPSRLETDRRLHVSVPVGTRPPQMVGIVGHQRSTTVAQRVGGLPVTTLLQTWIDLGPVLTRVELVTAEEWWPGAPGPGARW